MASHKATVRWQRDGGDFELATFKRDHEWSFEGGQTVKASAAPAYRGNPEHVDPEQAFTASVSACHMLTFLAMAAGKGIVVDRYEDQAEGILDKNDQGRMAMVKVLLRPRIVFAGHAPSEETVAQLHERAHKGCFIANSVTTEIEIGQPG